MVRLIPGAMERNLIGLGNILLRSSTSTQPQKSTSRYGNSVYNAKPSRDLVNSVKIETTRPSTNAIKPSDRSQYNSSKLEMSYLPLKWVGPTCQHEMG